MSIINYNYSYSYTNNLHTFSAIYEFLLTMYTLIQSLALL